MTSQYVDRPNSERRRLSRAEALALQHLADEVRGFRPAVERDEGAHARALILPEQDLVERLEPGLQVRERVALADLIDLVLEILGARLGRCAVEIAQQLVQS